MPPRSTQPSIPPSEPAHFRHLGQGGDRSMRVQMIVALVAGLVMIAVPLYLLRRPHADAATDPKAAAAASGSAGELSALAPNTAPPPPTAPKTPGLTLADAKVVKCTKPGEGKTPPEQCDRQPYFEEALVKAIRDNVSCMPANSPGGTVSYVLDIDHRKKKVHAFAGKSGTLKKKTAKEVVTCVNRSLPTPDWAQVPHQHVRYQINVLATYPPGSAGTAP